MMELTLDKKELEAILLDWAKDKFPNQFNKAKFGSSYSADFCTLTKEEPEPESAK